MNAQELIDTAKNLSPATRACMSERLDQVAVITSTSSGIGRAFALLLACEGFQMFEGIGVKGKK